MLISLSRKFIFVANLKSASTSIEDALAPFAEIRLTRSEWGKHRPLSALEVDFPEIFSESPRRQFLAFGVIREPVDWLRSLYRSHKGAQFEGTDLSTTGMTFGEFVDEWVPRHPDQTAPQTAKFEDRRGIFALDFLLRFDRLDQDFAVLCDMLDVPRLELGFLNQSVDIDTESELDEAAEARVRERYARDYFAFEKLASQRRGGGAPESPSSAATPPPQPSAAPARPKLVRDDVIWAYRYLLGREPESEAAIVDHLTCRDRAELRMRILRSEEFRGFFGEHVAEP